MPALAPVVPTQARRFLGEAATVLGNSPGMGMGWPSGVRVVGSEAEMAIMARVSEPGLTAKRDWGVAVSWGVEEGVG